MSKMRFVLPLMLVLAACWASDMRGDPIFDEVHPQLIQEVPDDYRLPENIVPTQYFIELEPFIDIQTPPNKNFTFMGKSVIDIKVKKETSTIILHAKNLTFTKYKLEYQLIKTPKTMQINGTKSDLEKDFQIFTLMTPLKTDMENVKLTLEYTGEINNQPHGFYRSSYVDNENNKRWLASTQFEPVSARQAFPCWDEPGIKAYFNIVIKHDEKYMALSNTKVQKKSKDPKSSKYITTFEKTPMMSTYLVAFVISDYKKYSNNETFNVWTRYNAINSTKYAYDFGESVLAELDEWTKIPYYSKIKKMDQVTIPVLGGAMENWGLVTYRESGLLYTEDKTTTIAKQGIATVIAHEFAHQWFGNLVTPKWWDQIWLNEGFATFFQYYIAEQALRKNNEDWRLMEQFIVNNVQVSSFVIDASSKTRPMNANPSVKTPDQINSLFDNISYKKAASVIHMMQHFLSDEVFQTGIREYLKTYEKPENSVVTYTNLFNVINKVAQEKKILNMPLNEIMNHWVNEAGYPVVTARRNNSNIVLEQKRFFLVKPLQQNNIRWYIPIDYIKQSQTNYSKIEWLKPEEDTKVLTTVEEDKWILINKNQTGYYRVNYEESNWNLLAKYLREVKDSKFELINAVTRAQLIDDALNLARAGEINYGTSLNMTLYLEHEKDYIPWHTAAREFDSLDKLLQGTKRYKLFKKYVAHKTELFVKEMDIENVATNETHINKLAKVLALNIACKYGVKKCEEFAEKKLLGWLEDQDGKQENKIWIDYRADVLCAGLRKADVQTWKNTLGKYQTTTDEDEKNDILTALGCVKDKKIILEFLESTLEKNPVINVFNALNSVRQGNPASVDLLIEFIANNIDNIRGKNSENMALVLQHLNLIAYRITTADQHIKVVLMLHKDLQKEQKDLEGLSHALDNIVWLEKYEKEVNKWIQNNQPNSASSFVFPSFLVIISMLFTRL